MNNRMPFAFSGLLASIVLITPLMAAEPAGHWVGVVETPGSDFPLELELGLDDEVWSADLIFPQEGNFRITADSVDVEGRELSVEAIDGAMTLSARFEGDRLQGKATNRGNVGDLRLARSGSPAATELLADRRASMKEMRDRPFEQVGTGPGMDRLDRERVDALVEKASSSFTTAMVILARGEVAGEWLRDGESRPIEAMSVTKAVLNLVFGRLYTLGRIESLDQPVHEYFDQWGEGQRSRITIRHLLTHTSGLDPAMPTTELYQSGDFVRFALEAPMQAPPGTEVSYNNNTPNLLAAIAEEAAGEPLDEFLAGDLFAKLGIEEFGWSRDPAGNPHGMAGLQIHARDLARLGQLALDRGRWNDEQLIDASWFRESFSRATGEAEPAGMLAESAPVIGLLWFLHVAQEDGEEHVVGASHAGFLGQYLVLDFTNRLVAVRMIESSPAYDPETDGFRSFPDKVRSLVDPLH